MEGWGWLLSIEKFILAFVLGVFGTESPAWSDTQMPSLTSLPWNQSCSGKVKG